MEHRKHIAFVAFVAGFLLLLGLSWMGGRMEHAPHGLRFEPGGSSIRPLFVLITRGQLHTNYVTRAPGIKVARVGYVHRFYYASQDTIRPGSALRYWTFYYVAAAWRWLGMAAKFVGPRSDAFAGTASVLWLGYRATNSLFAEDAVLVSDRGLRLPLTPRMEDTRTNAEHLMNWEIPAPLTNHSKYRLTLPRLNQTILTFVYD
jgi:hypothetical protein